MTQSDYRRKIKRAEELRQIIGPRPRAKKVIMCHGVFDLVHPGHIRHLIYARSKADLLIASLTTDVHVEKSHLRRGNNLFKSGNRVEGVMSYAFAFGLRSSAYLYGGVYHRENGALLTEDLIIDGAPDSPWQQLFLSGVNLRVATSRRVAFLGDGDIRVFRSQDGVGQGWVGTAGLTLNLVIAGRPSGSRVVLSPTGRYRYGHVVVREGAESGLRGWEAGITLRVETGR